MDRRRFLTRSFLLAAAGLGLSFMYKPALAGITQDTGIDSELSGLWIDPYLDQPSSIKIESSTSGSLVKVTGTYQHKNYGQSTFLGAGVVSGKVLTINYDHPNNPNLGKGTLRLRLTKEEGKPALKGSCRKEDGSWSADNMSWHKV